MEKIDKILDFILGIHKSIYINFKYLSFKDAIRLPIWISRNTSLGVIKGEVHIIGKATPGMIKIGFSGLGIVGKFDKGILANTGEIIFRGKAFFGYGTRLSNNGILDFGSNTVITGKTEIVCNENIVIGNDCLISWDCLFMDTDFHKILDKKDNIINKNKKIIIGNHCWIGCRSVILKGTVIYEDTVVASSSVITSKESKGNIVITNNRIIHEKITWEV